MLDRRSFLSASMAIGTAGLFYPVIGSADVSRQKILAFTPTGRLTLLFGGDIHGNVEPAYFIEPAKIITHPSEKGLPGTLTGEPFLARYGLARGSFMAYATTDLDFDRLYEGFGKLGGAGSMKKLADNIRQERGAENVLLVSSGDSWVGSGISHYSGGRAVADVMGKLGVEAMAIDHEADLPAENFSDCAKLSKTVLLGANQGYKPSTIFSRAGVKIGITGLAYPHMSKEKSRNGIDTEQLSKQVKKLKTEGVDIVVLLSQAGFFADLKIAALVPGIDVIVSGHSHDLLWLPVKVKNTTIVSAGAHGKFLGRLDIKFGKGGIEKLSHKLYPVAPILFSPNTEIVKLIESYRAPYADKLDEKLVRTETTLYRRSSVHDGFADLLLPALQEKYDTDIAMFKGYRFGRSIPKEAEITMDDLLSKLSTGTASIVTFELQGELLKRFFETECLKSIDPDPFKRSGYDMPRIAGASFDLHISAPDFDMVRNVRVGNRALDRRKSYKVAAWAIAPPVSAVGIKDHDDAVYDVCADYLRNLALAAYPEKGNIRVIGG